MAAWNSFSAGVVSGTVIWVRSMLESSVVNESRVVDVVVDVGVVVVRLGVEFLLANDDFDDDDDDDSMENLNDDNLGDMKVVRGCNGFGNDVVRALHLLIHRVLVDRNAKRNIALSKDVVMFVVACLFYSARERDCLMHFCVV